MTSDSQGRVVRFTLQLEVLVNDGWLPVVRYDNAHEEAHIDYINSQGVTYEKVWLNVREPYNVAFTMAENDLKVDYLAHRSRFISQRKGT
ncbi:MAG: hypothetical protein M3440_15625 [Chloroflexota bacterium]|nr:hypothetical protein [Chloroflexota bacterium]